MHFSGQRQKYGADPSRVAQDFSGSNRKFLAAAQGYRNAPGQSSGAYLRSLQVGQDSDGFAKFIGHRAQRLNAGEMFIMAAMRKIQSSYVHARFEQPAQNPGGARCRTYGADDFGMSKAHRDHQKPRRRDSSLRSE